MKKRINRIGNYAVRNEGNYITYSPIGVMGGTSYRVNKKTRRIQRYRGGSSSAVGWCDEPKLRQKELNEILHRSERRYKENNNIFARIKRKWNNFMADLH